MKTSTPTSTIAPVAVSSSSADTTMPKYQVIRNVDIVSYVEAESEDAAIEEALECECAGKSETQENYTEAVCLDKPKRKKK